MRSPVRVVAVAGICLMAACGSGNTPTGNGTGTNYNVATGTMTASIDGAGWTANFLTHASLTSGTLSITGEFFNGNTATIRVITMAATNIQTTGTYSIGPSSPNGGNALMTLGSSVWSSVASGGSGTLIITALNATHVAGTFVFVGVMGSSPSNVTNGVFDIPF